MLTLRSKGPASAQPARMLLVPSPFFQRGLLVVAILSQKICNLDLKVKLIILCSNAAKKIAA
jgi:hypothetical protein